LALERFRDLFFGIDRKADIPQLATGFSCCILF